MEVCRYLLGNSPPCPGTQLCRLGALFSGGGPLRGRASSSARNTADCCRFKFISFAPKTPECGKLRACAHSGRVEYYSVAGPSPVPSGRGPRLCFACCLFRRIPALQRSQAPQMIVLPPASGAATIQAYRMRFTLTPHSSVRNIRAAFSAARMFSA